MAARFGQKLKLLYIIEILKKYTDEEHPMNANELCDLLEQKGVSAERKAIYNDIEMLIYYGCSKEIFIIISVVCEIYCRLQNV